MIKKINLILQDGAIYKGFSFGFEKEIIGEVVFNTSMTGYQEMLTDPSYRGQILIPTYPIIGNYGISKEDVESSEIQVQGFAVRQFCEKPSHNNSIMNLDQYLLENKTPGIYGLDTRSIVKKIRNAGVMMGAITTDNNVNNILNKINSIKHYDEQNFVSQVSRKEIIYDKRNDLDFKISVLDLGVKNNILRLLKKRNCAVDIFPYDSKAEEVLSKKPDGIVLSPGPGDPKNLDNLIPNIKKLIDSGTPILGICLGHQLIAKSFGLQTFKLPFGHRGANQPVKDIKQNRVYVTSQNHGYAVSNKDIHSDLEITHINMNDGTVSGLNHKKLPVFSIQYHSEASPGPKDSEYIFDEFLEKINQFKVSK